MSLVLDSSAALAWIYSEETTDPVRQVFNILSQAGAWVPGIWRLEIAKVLEIGVRRGRHDAHFRDMTFADLAQLPVQVDPETDRQVWGETLRCAERHNLTLYDAAYLELALRRNLPLATLDKDLRSGGIIRKDPIAWDMSTRTRFPTVDF